MHTIFDEKSQQLRSSPDWYDFVPIVILISGPLVGTLLLYFDWRTLPAALAGAAISCSAFFVKAWMYPNG